MVRGGNLLKYERLSDEMTQRIIDDRKNNTQPKVAFCEDDIIRRYEHRDQANIVRTAVIRDIDKIIHCPYYNRYADKTQVFSFYKNDEDEAIKNKVNTSINKALLYLSANQNDNGTFSDSYSGSNANSTAMVIIALTSAGIDLANDEMFIKNGNTIIDGLLSFSLENNSGFGFISNDIINNFFYINFSK